MLDDQDQASCPRCGSPAQVRSLGQLMADAGPGQAQAMWARAGQPPVSAIPPGQTRGDFADGDSGGAPDFGETLFGFAMSAAGYVLRRTVGRGLKRAFEERVLPAASKNLEAYRNQQLQLAERYPDLRVCLQDKVVFAAAGSRVVPFDRLAGRRPADLDAALGALAAELRG